MSAESAPASATPRVPFGIALIPVGVLVALLYVNVRIFESSNNQVPLVLSAMVAALLARLVLKRPWQDLERGILNAIQMALQAILILMVVGLLR